jgi:hypothetical protein
MIAGMHLDAPTIGALLAERRKPHVDEIFSCHKFSP